MAPALRLSLPLLAACAFVLACGAMLAAPAPAEARIDMGKVKRINKAHVRDEQCFDTCLDWGVKNCKRISPRRARCKGFVAFDMSGAASRCRVTNRWKQDGRGVEIYSISKRCKPI